MIGKHIVFRISLQWGVSGVRCSDVPLSASGSKPASPNSLLARDGPSTPRADLPGALGTLRAGGVHGQQATTGSGGAGAVWFFVASSERWQLDNPL